VTLFTSYGYERIFQSPAAFNTLINSVRLIIHFIDFKQVFSSNRITSMVSYNKRDTILQ